MPGDVLSAWYYSVSISIHLGPGLSWEEVTAKKTFSVSCMQYTGAVGIYHWPIISPLRVWEGKDKIYFKNFTVDKHWC